MKAIIKTSLALLAGVALFSACEKDMDGNPTLQVPTSFTLNTPDYANQVVDLSSQDSLAFSWEQPKYGFAAQCDYGMQFSTSNKWTLSTDDVDNTGATIANYANVGGVTHALKGAVASADLATAIQAMMRYESNAVPASQDVYARTYSVLNGDTVFSDVVKLQVKPYYVQLKAAPIETWYVIGNGIADGSWGATGAIPLLPQGGEKYDQKTGQGVISWTGYLLASGFKVVKVPGEWKFQWGQVGSFGNFSNKADNPGNITVPSDGYYTVTLDTKNEKLTVTPYKGTVAAPYTKMNLPGSYLAWDPATVTPMTAFSNATYNHDWKATVTFSTTATGKDDGCKFAANGTWDVKTWGGDAFPYGNSTGDNIKFKKGSYTVYFNDITGQYSFVEQ